MSEVSVAEAETVPGDTPFEKPLRRITYQCAKCGRVWKRTFKAMPANDPPCPNKACEALAQLAALKLETENLRRMLVEQRAPGHIGDNPRVQAVDRTAEIVMKDYGMTDLKDNIREGDNMAPKLPPVMQRQADNLFGGKAMKSVGLNDKQIALMNRRAISGAYRRMAVAPNVILPSMKPMPVTVQNPGYVKR